MKFFDYFMKLMSVGLYIIKGIYFVLKLFFLLLLLVILLLWIKELILMFI